MGCQGSKRNSVVETEHDVLTEDNKQKVRESWDQYRKDPNFRNNACLIFFKMFELAPACKPLFHFVSDLTEEALVANPQLQSHAKRVTDAISLVINNIDDEGVVADALNVLGGRHVSYGAKPEYIMPVAQGVVYSLQRTLGEKFTEDHKNAWLAVLSLVGRYFAKGLKEKSASDSGQHA